MIVWRNKVLPFEGYSHLTWLFICFERDERGVSYTPVVALHEGIHSYQQVVASVVAMVVLLPLCIVYDAGILGWVFSVLCILFAGWLLYGLSWVLTYVWSYVVGFKSYYTIPQEVEAYAYERSVGYLRRRIPVWGYVRCFYSRALLDRAWRSRSCRASWKRVKK